MSRVKARVNAGVCGYVTEIVATSEDEQMVQLAIETPCKNISGLASRLPGEVDSFHEIGAGWDGVIHQTAHASLRGMCSACVVPNSIFKTMQVAAGLALPREIAVEFDGAPGEA